MAYISNQFNKTWQKQDLFTIFSQSKLEEEMSTPKIQEGIIQIREKKCIKYVSYSQSILPSKIQFQNESESQIYERKFFKVRKYRSYTPEGWKNQRQLHESNLKISQIPYLNQQMSLEQKNKLQNFLQYQSQIQCQSQRQSQSQQQRNQKPIKEKLTNQQKQLKLPMKINSNQQKENQHQSHQQIEQNEKEIENEPKNQILQIKKEQKQSQQPLSEKTEMLEKINNSKQKE